LLERLRSGFILDAMLRPPAVISGARRRDVQSGFSLMELLVVFVILATLGLIAFGIFQGVSHQASTAHARSDLAALSQALEQYHRQYGDYPETADSPEELYRALTGRLGPTGALLHGRSLLPVVPVNLQDPDNPDSPGNYFVDPWGNAYQYVFFTRQAATAPLKRGYVLFSFGHHKPNEPLPSRTEVVPDTSGAQGGVVSTAAINAQNLYAGH
jgi:prepilin-type N-terminal cleavage/methylation domain-containing protein